MANKLPVAPKMVLLSCIPFDSEYQSGGVGFVLRFAIPISPNNLEALTQISKGKPGPETLRCVLLGARNALNEYISEGEGLSGNEPMMGGKDGQ